MVTVDNLVWRDGRLYLFGKGKPIARLQRESFTNEWRVQLVNGRGFGQLSKAQAQELAVSMSLDMLNNSNVDG